VRRVQPRRHDGRQERNQGETTGATGAVTAETTGATGATTGRHDGRQEARPPPRRPARPVRSRFARASVTGAVALSTGEAAEGWGHPQAGWPARARSRRGGGRHGPDGLRHRSRDGCPRALVTGAVTGATGPRSSEWRRGCGGSSRARTSTTTPNTRRAPRSRRRARAHRPRRGVNQELPAVPSHSSRRYPTAGGGNGRSWAPPECDDAHTPSVTSERCRDAAGFIAARSGNPLDQEDTRLHGLRHAQRSAGGTSTSAHQERTAVQVLPPLASSRCSRAAPHRSSR